MNLKEFVQSTKGRFQNAGIETSSLDARILICHALNITHEKLLLSDDRVFSDDEIAALEKLIVQRIDGKPVAKIIGQKEFYGRMFKTTTDTLDPRPDSETLIEAILEKAEDRITILDLGTGTGCLVLTLLAERPKAQAIAVDQSDAALKIAKENAWAIGVEDRVVFIQSDWFNEVVGTFDIIVSNPPYIAESDIPGLAKEVRVYDPMSALIGGKDGLDPYRIIIPQLSTFLNPNGLVAFELGQGQDLQVAEMLTNAGFVNVFTKVDLGGIARVVGGFWLQKPPIEVQ